MNFSDVTSFLERIEQLSGRLEMTQELARLFEQADEAEILIICNLVLGQLHPPYIGTNFGIAEKSMVSIIAQFLNIDVSKIKRLIQQFGDLGAVIAHERSSVSKANLTLQQVYNALCKIEEAGGAGSQEQKGQMLNILFEHLEGVSAKYVVRIILGKLRLGFSDMTMVDALSWMVTGDKSLRNRIEEAYNRCADIGLIAAKIKKKGIKGLDSITIQVGIPIRPAAAERLPTAQAVIDKIGPCVAQPKFDGFRLQVHVDKSDKNPVVNFFSRNLQDMSTMFPDLVNVLSSLHVKTVICEGEAIGYNPDTGEFLPFQETVKRKRKHEIEKIASAYPLRLFLFDLLYLDGEPVLNKTHSERRKLLLQIVPKDSTAVLVTPEVEVKTAKELEKYFLAEVEAGLEGLVVKKPDAIYQAGKRNFNWIKLKRRQQGQIEDTIDCVILGYYHGTGKRAQLGIGAFLVGVYNKQEDIFQTIAKVGTGLTDEGWKILKKLCEENVVEQWSSGAVSCAKELVPDVMVMPKIVCVVLADEITLSPLHTAGKTEKSPGFALRFPRFIGYREDKGPFDATDVIEIRRLYEDQY